MQNPVSKQRSENMRRIHAKDTKIELDDEVNKELLFHGWTVIRFWGKDILKKPDECLRIIEETIFEGMLAEHDADDE